MAVHDLYRAFSDDMAARLERGDAPWAPEASGRPLRWTGQAYGGVNVLAQWSAMREEGYRSPFWLSRSTISSLGGRLADGARPVTAWYTGMRPVWAPSRETGEVATRIEQSWRPYAVWNAGTVEGLADTFARVDRSAPADEGPRLSERLASLAAEAGCDPDAAIGASGERSNAGVCRSLVRWAGQPARLNRGADGPREGLTVEIGAAFLAAVESWRKTVDADQAVQLLDAARRIDLEVPGVADAIRAAARAAPNRKARAKRRAAEQKEARERRREEVCALEVRRQRTGAGTVANSATHQPAIRRHDAAALPLIRELREGRATWQEIAAWLDGHSVSPPGRRVDYAAAGWSRTVVWRNARRHRSP